MSTIIFVLDLELSLQKFEITKRLLHRFVVQKFFLNPFTFGIITLTNTLNWHLLLTKEQQEIHDSLDQLKVFNGTINNQDWPQEMLKMTTGINDSQILLIYARNSMPNIQSNEITSYYKLNPTLVIDLIFLHDKLMESNSDTIEQTYLQLQRLLTTRSKKFELYKNVNRLMMIFAELLSNPFQRKLETNFEWNLDDAK